MTIFVGGQLVRCFDEAHPVMKALGRRMKSHPPVIERATGVSRAYYIRFYCAECAMVFSFIDIEDDGIVQGGA